MALSFRNPRPRDAGDPPSLVGITVALVTGFVAFLFVNFAVGVIANPRFPNEEGPVPGWLYLVVAALSVALLLRAVLRPRARADTAGFVLGYVVMTVASSGGLTTTWTRSLSLLDPSRPLRERRRAAARADSVNVAVARQAVARKASWSMSDEGRAGLALHALVAGACALDARRGGATQDPASRTGAIRGARPCASYRADSDSLFTVSFGARPGVGGGAPAILALRPRDPALAHPAFLVDTSGLATVQLNARDRPHAVASPVAELRRIRSCLIDQASDAKPGATLRLLDARRTYRCGNIDVYADSLAPAAGDGEALRLCMDLHGRYACGRGTPVITYRVRLARAEGDASGFALLADPAPGSPGLRRYYLGPDGAVIATGERRDARPGDPPAAACEVNPAMPCAVR